MITASATREAGGRDARSLVAFVRPVIRHGRGGNGERDGYAGQHQCAGQPSRSPLPLIALHAYQSTPTSERES
jgi:hypothetical protein